jgi:hypothetical protein
VVDTEYPMEDAVQVSQNGNRSTFQRRYANNLSGIRHLGQRSSPRQTRRQSTGHIIKGEHTCDGRGSRRISDGDLQLIMESLYILMDLVRTKPRSTFVVPPIKCTLPARACPWAPRPSCRSCRPNTGS